MTIRTYVIDAAHGADDVSCCDWNTRIEDNSVSFNFDPAATSIKICAPGTRADFGLDDTTTRSGLLFRGVDLGGETLAHATLRLYLTGWDPVGFTDPVTGQIAQNPYFFHVHGCADFPPAPGYNEYPNMDEIHWGNLPAASCISKGTGVRIDGHTTGAGGPTAWGTEHKPGWTAGTRCWYPSRFDSGGYGSQSVTEHGRRTLARAIVGVERGPAGYIDIDVTAVVQEVMSFDRVVPAWTARTYTMLTNRGYDAKSGGLLPVSEWPRVIAPNGYVYVFCGNGVPEYDIESLGSDAGVIAWPRGQGGSSATAPSATVIGGEEQPDGPGTAIWRCARYGQPRNWQGGDHLAFVLLQRPEKAGPYSWDSPMLSPPYLKYLFPETTVPGYRTFASGDLGDAAKYPTLVLETEGPGEGALTLATSISISSDGSLAYTNEVSMSATLGMSADAVAYDAPARLPRNLSLGRAATLYGDLFQTRALTGLVMAGTVGAMTASSRPAPGPFPLPSPVATIIDASPVATIQAVARHRATITAPVLSAALTE